jgi:hypothetical protein
MRVLVLVPTTGKLNRVLRIDPYPDLVHSFVVRQGDVERLQITRKYADLTSQGGPLAALGAPVTPGLYRLLLAGPIDAGDSWQLPVLLAHLAVALGEKLAEEPAEGDVVLWSTGAVDVDLNIVDHDYRLPAKVACSRAVLQEAVAAGAQIVAILPACARDDAPRLHDMLAEIGAQHARLEIVDSVVTARGIVEQALGRTPAVVSEAASRPLPLVSESVRETASSRSGSRGLFWKVPALLATGAAMAVGVFIFGNQWLPPLIPHGTPGNAAPRIRPEPPPDPPRAQADATADPSRGIPGLPPPPNPVVDTARESDVSTPARPDILPFKAPDPRPDILPAPPPEARPDIVPSPPPSEVIPVKTPPSPPPVPVKLQELRFDNNGTCIPYIFERRPPPLAIDVALEGTDHFHDSAGRNLCVLEWTLTPEAAQAGIEGFDIVDLADRSGSTRLDRTGAAGVSTRIRIEFTRDFRNTNPITYNVRLRFGGASPPEQVQQFRHAVR